MGGIVRISTTTPWEPIVGYSRAVRAGDWVLVSGTTATDARGSLVGIGQMYVQAQQAIANLASALGRVGLGLRDVVRTRMFVTDISRFAEAGRAHREAFGETPPATSMVEVRRLAHPDMLFEIEADAYAGSAAKSAVAPAAKPAPARAAAPKAKVVAKPKAARKAPARKPAKRR
jgi:enamine deaminase RidA (YjgF/YER057c/UK114 family)